MRITFVQRGRNLSGGQRMVAAYAEALQRRGHTVCVVSTLDPTPPPLRRILDRARGIDRRADTACWLDDTDIEHRLVPTPLEPSSLPDADVVIATWWETAEWVDSLPPAKGAKVYFIQGIEWTIGGMPAERVRQTWRLPLHKIVIADFLVSIAEQEFDDDDVSLVRNGIDPRVFHAEPRSKSASPTVGVMYPGPARVKGWDVALDALQRAKMQLPSLEGRCFGRAHPTDLPPWIAFERSPSPEALRALYAGCDVFMHAARAEGFGLPVLEAMACRTPVAATRAGAVPDLVPSGGGIDVPVEDAEALAAAIVTLAASDPADWARCSSLAYRVASAHTLEDATDHFEAALRRAVEKVEAPPAPPPSVKESGRTPFEHWVLPGPISRAAVARLLGHRGLLPDPFAREEGPVRVGADAELPVGSAPLYVRPPLRRVASLYAAETEGTVELWPARASRAPRALSLARGERQLVRAGAPRRALPSSRPLRRVVRPALLRSGPRRDPSRHGRRRQRGRRSPARVADDEPRRAGPRGARQRARPSSRRRAADPAGGTSSPVRPGLKPDARRLRAEPRRGALRP